MNSRSERNQKIIVRDVTARFCVFVVNQGEILTRKAKQP